MWKYNSPDELYHAGILGMRWGKRKAHTDEYLNNKIKSKALVKERKKKNLIKNNDYRVKLYGKTQVKAANAVSIGLTAYVGANLMTGLLQVGKNAMRKIAANPAKGDIPFRLAEAATIAAVASIGYLTVKSISKSATDIALTNKHK